MEIIRKAPGKIYYRSNTSVAIKLLAFLAVALVLLVLGVCLFVIFGIGNTKNYFLDATQVFYYSVNSDTKTARFELYVGKDKEYTVPASVSHKGATYPVTEIGAEAFTNNNKLTAVTVGNNVASIASNTAQKTGAFSGCINLQTVNFGENLRHIDNYAFKNCLQLKAIDLPVTVQFVGAGAFMNNLALTKIKLNGGNTRLDTDSFQFCDQVTTLTLSDNVILDNDKKCALAMLTNLTNFELSPNNTRYKLDAANNYLLNTAGDTVIIGGKNAKKPTFSSEITKIEDWAFGERYGSADIFVPQTVTAVETNAFSTGIIYTDAATKPADWQTKLPVRCGAEKVTFYRNYAADDTVTADAYTFTTDPEDDRHYLKQGATFYPTFQSLFGETDDERVLTERQWEAVDTSKYYAEYENSTPATADGLAALDNTIKTAEDHFPSEIDTEKQNNRLRYTLNFWEEFKSAYGAAKNVYAKGSAALGYEVKNATKNLQSYLEQLELENPTSAIIVDDVKDWRKNLSDFLVTVAVVKKEIDAVENEATNNSNFVYNKDLWTRIGSDYDKAEKCLANNECLDEDGMSAWRVLRMDYENLRVKFTENTPLNKLITECAALNANDYTAASWETFTQALNKARSITEYNTSVAQVRLALQEAKDNLVKNNLATTEQKTALAAWVSLCGDLREDDYTQTSYDRMLLAWQKVNAQLAEIDLNTMTVDEAQGALNTLRSNYESLIAVDKELTESGNTVVKSLAPYFIVAVVLFTVAIIIQAVASSLKKTQRSKKHE